MRETRRCRTLTTTLAVVLLASCQVGAQEKLAPPPMLYGFCMDMPGEPNASIPDQAKLLNELGYDGVGYPLWLGDQMDENLRVLDQVDLPLYLVYTTVNLASETPAFDPGVSEAIAKLKGRPTTISVPIRGLPPGDRQGMRQAVEALRELGDLAAESGLRISVYHHLNDWTESLLFALEVVERVDHPAVGVNFNLCHWLKVDGEKDYRDVLRENADRIFAVTINGAQCDATDWTDGLIQPLDCGDFDNRELLGILKEVGYQGPIGLMCYGVPDDTREHLQRSKQVWDSWHGP